MGLLFEKERRLRCAIAAARDVAATTNDPDKRAGQLMLANDLTGQLPRTLAERLLLAGD